MKHTPGPWDYFLATSTVLREYFVASKSWPPDGETTYIAADIIDPLTGDPSEANARLIAAAPELLEALEMCVRAMKSCLPDFSPFDDAAYGKARAAIAKATGGEV